MVHATSLNYIHCIHSNPKIDRQIKNPWQSGHMNIWGKYHRATILDSHWNRHGLLRYQVRQENLSLEARRNSFIIVLYINHVSSNIFKHLETIINKHQKKKNMISKKNIDIVDWYRYQNTGPYADLLFEKSSHAAVDRQGEDHRKTLRQVGPRCWAVGPFCVPISTAGLTDIPKMIG